MGRGTGQRNREGSIVVNSSIERAGSSAESSARTGTGQHQGIEARQWLGGAHLPRSHTAQRRLGVLGRLVRGRPDVRRARPRTIGLDQYAYVLEAAAAGHGIALGWAAFHRAAPRHRGAGHTHRPLRRLRQPLLRRAHREGATQSRRPHVLAVLCAVSTALVCGHDPNVPNLRAGTFLIRGV